RCDQADGHEADTSCGNLGPRRGCLRHLVVDLTRYDSCHDWFLSPAIADSSALTSSPFDVGHPCSNERSCLVPELGRGTHDLETPFGETGLPERAIRSPSFRTREIEASRWD